MASYRSSKYNSSTVAADIGAWLRLLLGQAEEEERMVDIIQLDANRMTGREMLNYFHWRNSSSCRLSHDYRGKQVDILHVIDGQKAVCMDGEVRPVPGHCVVYSFGINDDWSFEEAMEQSGCRVYAFDPSISLADHNHTAGIQFFNLGIGSSDYQVDKADDGGPGYRLQTLKQIYDRLGGGGSGDGVIDYLKLDVEEEEWNS